MQLTKEQSTFLQLLEKTEKSFVPTTSQEEVNWGQDNASKAGIKINDYVTFGKGYKNHKWYKTQAQSIKDKIEMLKNSQHPIQVTALKAVRKNDNDGAIMSYMVDIVETPILGQYFNAMTVPDGILKVLDVKLFPPDGTGRLIKQSQREIHGPRKKEKSDDSLHAKQTMVDDKQRNLSDKNVKISPKKK